jgi:hypothetical protein
MLQILLWALGTGFVSGAVWFGILFFRRHPTRPVAPRVPARSGQQEILSPDDVTRRLLEVEERLDATEHLLRRERVEQPRNPRR